MKQKLIRRILAMALSIFLVLGIMPISSAEIMVKQMVPLGTSMMAAVVPGLMVAPLAGGSAAITSGSAIENDWSWMTVNDTKINTTVIHYAGSEWYVVGYNGNDGGVATTSGAITLFSVGEFGAKAQFNKTGTAGNNYINSNLRNELTKEVRFTGIDARERSVMVSRSLDDVGINLPEDQLWALSIDEANTLNVDLRKFTAYWWLRSPGGANNTAAAVNTAGTSVVNTTTYITSSYAIRPAFNLDLASVVFAYAADSGKATTAGQTLSAVTVPTQKAKLTVIDSNTENLNLTVEQGVINGIEGKSYAPGNPVEIAYSDAKTGTNKYVSCVIMDNNGRVTHYGKLSQTASGTATFTVPTLADGSYTIKLFNEECNGDRNTDYAGEPIEIQMTVVKPVEATYTVTLPTGTGYTATAQSGSTNPVNIGGSYSFKVELDDAYSKSIITVKANDTIITPVDSVYTISNITADQTITVENVELNTYTVTLPSGTGYTATAQSGSASPVNIGGSYSFKVELGEAYSMSTITVKANDTTITPVDSVYTISNITADQTITVTGVELNTTDTATATLNIQKDDMAWSDHGKMFTLKLSTDEAITTDMTGTDGTVTATVQYGTWKIYEGSAYTGVNITVDGTGGTETLNYYTVKFTVIDAVQ
jgi:hypothetical protein